MLTRRGFGTTLALLGAAGAGTARAQTRASDKPQSNPNPPPEEVPATGKPLLPTAPPTPAQPIVCLLSIDGGGIRGVAAAAILREIDDALFRAEGLRLIDCVDVFAGTSTGSIIAAGLAASKDRSLPYWSPQAIIDIYKNRGPEIFGRHARGRLWDRSRQRWESAGLETTLRDVFADRKLADLPGNLMVPYYNMGAAEGKSAVLSLGGQIADRANTLSQQEVRRVVAASSSAPTYFNPQSMEGGSLGIDGGVFANNPALAAWVALQKMYPGSQVVVLSIGCGTRRAAYRTNIATWGAIEWMNPLQGAPLIDVLMRGQSDLVDGQLNVLLEPQKNYFRFQFSLDGSPYGKLDDASPANLAALEAMGVEAVRTRVGQGTVRSLILALKTSRERLTDRPDRAIPGTSTTGEPGTTGAPEMSPPSPGGLSTT